MTEHPTCPVEGCENFSRAKTRPTPCLAHYQLEYRGIDPATRRVPNVREESTCDVDGCRSPKVNTRVCSTHYHQVRMGELVIPGYSPKPFPPCQGPDCEKRGHWSGYCTTHGGHIQREGRPRKVVFQREKECSVDNCTDAASAKGMCVTHYHQKRAAERGLRTTACTTPGCATRVRAPGPCGPHKTERLRQERALLAQGQCECLNCEKTVTMWSSRVCASHKRYQTSKGLSHEQLIELMAVQACESCGNVEKLVTDHKHGHHNEDSKKMCPDCIRGRLCNGCNSALGYLGEDEARIEGLLAYIRRFHGDPVRSGA